MRVQSLGFSTDLMVRRLAGSILEDRADHVIVRTPHIPSYWWGNFILLGRPLQIGDAAWLRETSRDAFPHATNLVIGIDGTDGDVGSTTEAAELGLETIASAVMIGDAFSLNSAAAHHGTRELTSDDDWTQLATLREAWQGPPADDADVTFRSRRLAEQRELTQRHDAAWFGSFEGDVLAAAAGIIGDRTGAARYQDVETHPDHRRKGHARRVLQGAAGYARDHLSAKHVVIVADPAYHAYELYRSLGFTEIERQVQLQGRTAPM